MLTDMATTAASNGVNISSDLLNDRLYGCIFYPPGGGSPETTVHALLTGGITMYYKLVTSNTVRRMITEYNFKFFNRLSPRHSFTIFWIAGIRIPIIKEDDSTLSNH